MDPVDGTAVAVREQPPAAVFRTEDPVEIMQRTAQTAGALKDFVASQRLTTKISGRDYLLVEAWQTLGMMLGVTPAVVTSEPVEHGWQSRVELHDRNGRLVGSGEGQCLATEEKWSDRDDYARRSMAQTRALGKAYRNTFGFIAKAAGFEATPAEKMPGETAPFGREVDPAFDKQVKQACGRLAGGAEPGSKLWLEIREQLGGYMPHAAAVALLAVDSRQSANTAA